MKEGTGNWFGADENMHMFLDKTPGVTWWCIDHENLILEGNFQTPSFRTLTFQVKLKEKYCVPNSPVNLCELPLMAENMMSQVEFMVAANAQHFDQGAYDYAVVDSPISNHTEIAFFRYPSSRLVNELRIEQTELARDDLLAIALSGLTSISETYFSVSHFGSHTST